MNLARNRMALEVKLTPRELDVAELITLGFSNRTIGEIMYVQTRTVERFIGSINDKLGFITFNKNRVYSPRTLIALYVLGMSPLHSDRTL